MKAIEVNPQNWLWDSNYKPKVLYDNNYYSIIWGKYKNIRALGVRYNDDDNESGVGYPHQGAYPTWYIEPDFIAAAILQRLLISAIDSGVKEYLDNIIFAINELSDKIAAK